MLPHKRTPWSQPAGVPTSQGCPKDLTENLVILQKTLKKTVSYLPHPSKRINVQWTTPTKSVVCTQVYNSFPCTHLHLCNHFTTHTQGDHLRPTPSTALSHPKTQLPSLPLPAAAPDAPPAPCSLQGPRHIHSRRSLPSTLRTHTRLH